MIIYGTRASNIGNFEVSDSKCSYCNEGDTQRVSVFGRYFHIFWIPIFPIGKKAVAECTHCKRTIEQKEFSPQLKNQYQEIKKNAKRPFWHWLGIGLVGLFIALVLIAGLTAEKDSRKELLDRDESSMDFLPTMESDSISYKIKQVFDSFATDEINPSDFKYRTRIRDNKALILVQIPKLRNVEKEGRTEALEMIKIVTDSQKDLENKELYIGIKGLVTMMIVKTPTYEDNSKLAQTDKLYDFYGPKPMKEK